MNKKTKEKVLKIIDEVITDKISDLMESMSDNEFVEEVGGRVYEEIGYDVNEKDEVEDLTDLIGERVVPLLNKLLSSIVGKDITYIPSPYHYPKEEQE
jgi:hypothetical protein